MKKLNYLLAGIVLGLFSCDSNTNQNLSEAASTKLNKEVKSIEAPPTSAFLIGHLVEDDEQTAYLLGPDDVKWEINQADIITKSDWEESFDGVTGEPTIVEMKLGSTFKDGTTTHTVQVEKAHNEPAGCQCEISCGYNRYCCKLDGFKPKCIPGGCGKTTERCD